MSMEVYTVLWLFFGYGLLGVVVETAYCSIWVFRGVFTSRMALLYLPFNPVYGCAGVLVGGVLGGVSRWPLLVFGLGLVLCTVLEFAVSLLLERGFKATLWDYREKPFNLGGRICLESAVVWGALSLLVVYLLDPLAHRVIALIPRQAGEVGIGVLIAITVVSAALTAAAFRRMRRRVTVLQGGGSEAGEAAADRLVGRLVPDSVFTRTFPQASVTLRFTALQASTT